MSHFRFGVSVAVVLVAGGSVPAATPKEIDASIQLGAGYLKDLYKGATPKQVLGGPNGLGAAALSGLALLETGTPRDDASVRAITAAVRDAAFTTTSTYHLALCILFLDKLGSAADVPLIQMLGVRLLAGQSDNGGWSYDCIEPVSSYEERDLRSALMSTELSTGNRPASGNTASGKNTAPTKPGVAAQLNADVAKYQGRLGVVRIRPRITDNSNTQFGVMGLWTARKHGVPVEKALDAIEKRFLSTQTANGGWPYAGQVSQGTPSMTCAGLLGLATAIGRREERSSQREVAKSSDPNNPPAAKPAPKVVSDDRNRAVQKALASLGPILASASAGRGKGPRFNLKGGSLGDRDLYFLWSVERVAVIYGLETIGGIAWYDVGADELVAAQNISGSWGRGGRGAEVDTAFALLFLARADLVHDLSTQVQRGPLTTELRTGGGPPLFGGTSSGDKPSAAPGSRPTPPAGDAKPPVRPESSNTDEPRRSTGVTVIRPGDKPSADEPKKIAAMLVASRGLEWDTLLTRARDANGNEYTQALLIAIDRLDGDRLKQAREALAQQLMRLTLRAGTDAADAVLRRFSPY